MELFKAVCVHVCHCMYVNGIVYLSMSLFIWSCHCLYYHVNVYMIMSLFICYWHCLLYKYSSVFVAKRC